MRIVCGAPWTRDGRWVVVGDLFGVECIVFDPGNNDDDLDLFDCFDFVGQYADTPA